MKNTKPSFIGQHFYIGIDVHKNSWTVTIISMGLHLKTFSMNPSPKELVRYMKNNYPGGIYHSVYEAGFSGFWIHRELKQAGIDNIVVNAADVPTTNKQKRRKTDKIDSKKLAKELSVGNLEGIYIPSERHEAIRSLSRLRAQLVSDQTRLKNRIKSLLHFSGVKIPGNDEIQHWSANFIKYLSELHFGYKEKKSTLDLLVEELKYTRGQIAKAIKQLRIVARQDKEINKIISHLISIPGIGFTTAAILYTEIMDMKRFIKFDKLVAYIGLAPDTDSSGEDENILGITKRQQGYLRSLLIEASWIAVRKDPAMTASYAILSQRMSKQRAIIRIAKKLLSRIMHLWNNQEDYVLSVVA